MPVSAFLDRLLHGRHIPSPETGWTSGQADALAAQRPLRRTTCITWSPNGALRLRPRMQAGTTCLTIGCGHDFEAVRVGMPLAAAAPVPAFETIAACVSSSWGDRFNPLGGHTPVLLRAATHGSSGGLPEADNGYTPATGMDDARGEAQQPSAGSRFATERTPTGPTGDNHFPDIPLWAWTEWTPLSSAPPDPETGLRVLMLRAYAPEGGDVVFANGQFEGYRGERAVNHGFDVWMGGVNNGWDLSDFRNFDVPPLLVNNPVNGTPLVAVQLRTRVAGIVGMVSGDSHQSGAATTAQANGFLLQAMTRLGSAHAGQIPFGIVNDAFGGARSREFLGRTCARLADIQPSFVVLPGWSYNDHLAGGDATEIDEAFCQNLSSAIAAVRSVGALPIILTPFPRNPEALDSRLLWAWLMQRERILRLGGEGEEVIDASVLLGERYPTQGGKALGGLYVPGLTADEMHPNDAGHARIADALVAIITRRLRTDEDITAGQ
jgi:hypothetical protein